jgi:hypothetical protein
MKLVTKYQISPDRERELKTTTNIFHSKWRMNLFKHAVSFLARQWQVERLPCITWHLSSVNFTFESSLKLLGQMKVGLTKEKP